MNDTPLPAEVIHLLLRGRRPLALVQDEEDWRTLGAIAARMLFWCGGSIHACRCEGPEMRFAISPGRAPIGAMAQHISGGYAMHLRRRRGWSGRMFHHYTATSVDAELYLDDLVIWLHRPRRPAGPDDAGLNICWTADSAYLFPHSLAWITTGCVLAALNRWGAGRSVYRRRRAQPIDADTVTLLTGRSKRRSAPARLGDDAGDSLPIEAPPCPNVERIARFVAVYSRISYQDLCSASRRRAIAKAKVLAAVLSTRHGASVATVARLVGRSRSSLIERAERYRQTQPEIFAQADRALHAEIR
jgi:hypothetical protein